MLCFTRFNQFSGTDELCVLIPAVSKDPGEGADAVSP